MKKNIARESPYTKCCNFYILARFENIHTQYIMFNMVLWDKTFNFTKILTFESKSHLLFYTGKNACCKDHYGLLQKDGRKRGK